MRKHDRILTKLANECRAVLSKTNGGHMKLTGDGWTVFTSSTPSDRRSISNIRRDIRLALREIHA